MLNTAKTIFFLIILIKKKFVGLSR